jgi:DNA-binding transcriptional LysR family regulator
MPLRNKVPSAQALFTFESAARTLNFTEAAAILNVTQPAISKGVASLESHLGTRLFLRQKGGLLLTPDGEVLYRAVQLSFTALEAAIDQISRQNRQDKTLTFSTSTAFAAHWLIPQMQDFRRDFPDVTLNFMLTAGEADGALGACDLGTRIETRIAPGDRAVPFMPEWIMAVSSPEYILRNGPLDAPREEAMHSVVKLDNARISWHQFLYVTGQTLSASVPEIRVPDYSVVVQSALNGRGVALGFALSCSYLLREGLLKPAMPKTLKTGRNYCLVTNGSSPKLETAERVQEWIINRSQTILDEILPLFDAENVVTSRMAP